MSGRVRQGVANLLRSIESTAWDLWLNVRTGQSDGHAAPAGHHGDAEAFETNAHRTIRRAIRLVGPGSDDVVVVIGCGKGRTVSHFARAPVRRVIGMEISRDLAEAASVNASRMRGRRAPIEIRNVDAAAADYSDGTLFFMFNPFGAATLQAVLRRIEESRRPAAVRTRLAYVNPACEEVVASCGWLEETDRHVARSGLRTTIYREIRASTPGATERRGVLSDS